MEDIMVGFLMGTLTSYILPAWTKNKIITPAQISEGDINFDELTERIEALSDLKEQLYDVENMITEIEAAEQKERGIALNLSMPTSARKYNFLVNNQSGTVLDLLHEERQKLRSSIVNELSKITIRSNGNVTETMRKNRKICRQGSGLK